MSFDPVTSPVDYILLASQRSPGFADVKGLGTPRKWEERRSYGFGGAISVYRGRSLSKFSVALRLYTAEDWEDWHAWRPLVERPPVPEPDPTSPIRSFGRTPRALDIWHPILEDFGIVAVGIEDVLQPLQTADGEWTIEIKFIEYRRPRFALSKPKGSQDRPSTDPVDIFIEQLSAQNDALAAELNE